MKHKKNWSFYNHVLLFAFIIFVFPLSALPQEQPATQIDTLNVSNDSGMFVQKHDSLTVITEEDIKKEVKFGIVHKIISISIGLIYGGLIGGTVGNLVDARIHNNDFPVLPGYSTAIGLSTGMIGGAYLNYKIVDSLVKKENRKKIQKKSEKEMHKN